MSTANPEGNIEISRDGVSVVKSFEPDDFPVAAIAFVVRSERETTVSVRMVDTVPDDVPAEDIGFHPKWGAEFWSVEGEEIVFERRFEPGEEYTTVYGLRGRDVDDVDRFMSKPTIEAVDAESDDDSSVIVRNVIGSNGDDTGQGPSDDDIASAIAAADTDVEFDQSTEPDDANEEVVDLSDPSEDSSDSLQLGIDDAETEGPDTSLGQKLDAGTDDDTLVSQLAEEIRDGAVDDEDLSELREVLGTKQNGRLTAQVKHLQTQMADLEAYTEAFESFLDENGDAQMLISDLQSDFKDATGRIDTLEDRLDDQMAAVDKRVGEKVDEELEELWEEVDETALVVEELTEQIESTRDAIESDLEELRSTLESDIDTLQSDLESIETELFEGEIGTRVDEIEDDVSELEDTLGDELADFEEEISKMETELDDLADMRERLKSAFGALGASNEDAN